MNIDFDRYKRIFAFGCSFTQYGWPTWADLIALDNPNKKYYNYGLPGLGNLGIASRISEANKRYQFNENDLVIVMWSTFCREDRWVNYKWLTNGNIYNSEYSKDWIEKYADPMGYLIRDHALINLTNSFFKQSKFGSLVLTSSPFEFVDFGSIDDEEFAEDLKLTYSKDYHEMPLDLYTFMGKDWGLCRQKFYEDMSDEPFMREDSHPFTSLYADYLENAVGIQLKEPTKTLAETADHQLKQATKRSEIMKAFKYLENIQSKDKKKLF